MKVEITKQELEVIMACLAGNHGCVSEAERNEVYGKLLPYRHKKS